MDERNERWFDITRRKEGHLAAGRAASKRPTGVHGVMAAAVAKPVPQPPTMKLGMRDIVRVEQYRHQKAEMQALRQQVEEIERKAEADRALMEQVPDAMAELATLRDQVPKAQEELATLRKQVPDAMAEIETLRSAVAEAEKNKEELTAQMEKNKAEYAAEIAGLKEAHKTLDAALKARPVVPAITKSSSLENARRVSSSSPNGRLSAAGTFIQVPKPVVEEPSKGIWGGLVSYFKTPKEEVPEPKEADFDGPHHRVQPNPQPQPSTFQIF